jgi:DNA-binding GntR family transcriptional regulator
VPLQIPKLENQSLRDRVLDAIEQALVSGALKPEDRVVEAEIAREAGISRGPVREAIQQLVGEGILVSIPHRGTFVARWTERDVAETYSMRALLESYAASLAMTRMSPQESAEMEAIVDEMFRRAREGNAPTVLELDLRFHHRLYELSGHTMLERMLGELRRRISMLVNFDASTTPDLVEYAQNHKMLLDALRTGDRDHVEHAFRAHIIAVGDALIHRMSEESKLFEARGAKPSAEYPPTARQPFAGQGRG